MSYVQQKFGTQGSLKALRVARLCATRVLHIGPVAGVSSHRRACTGLLWFVVHLGSVFREVQIA